MVICREKKQARTDYIFDIYSGQRCLSAVYRALNYLSDRRGDDPIGLCIKDGTSVSKAYGLIRRFSQDIGIYKTALLVPLGAHIAALPSVNQHRALVEKVDEPPRHYIARSAMTTSRLPKLELAAQLDRAFTG